MRVLGRVVATLVASLGLSGAQEAEFPASDDCDVGSGFDFTGGCQYASAVQALQPCSAGTEACLETTTAEDITEYTRNVRSASDHSSLVNSVTTAEGGGYGISVSTSFGYLRQSKVTERSQAFFLGESGTLKREYVKNFVNLKLTDVARDFLDQNPEGFLRRYGLHYVYAVVYGGSFLGSFTVNAKETSDTTDVKAFASISARKAFFEVGASEAFESKASEMSEHVEVYANAKWGGGYGVSLDPSSPTSMSKTYKQWEDSWRQHPKRLRIVTRKWIDSADVQAIVNQKSQVIQDAFNAPLITQVTRDALSQEDGKMMLVAESVSQALQWPVSKENRTLYTTLTSLNSKILQHRNELAVLDEEACEMRQSEILNDNSSWFVADSLRFKFEDLTSMYSTAYECQSEGFRLTNCQADGVLIELTDGTRAEDCRVDGKVPNERVGIADCVSDQSLGSCETAYGGAAWSCVFPPHSMIHMACKGPDITISSGAPNLPAGCVQMPGGTFWSESSCASACGSVSDPSVLHV